MNAQYADFVYRSLPDIPKEFRQVDWTFIDVYDKAFSEAEEAFTQLKSELREAFSDKPFAHLHFLRAIENRLVMLAVVKREPISKILECLRRRLDLEYGRGDIFGKSALLIAVADYAVKCGETELAAALLNEEMEQLNETADVCQHWLKTVSQRIDRLRDEEHRGN